MKMHCQSKAIGWLGEQAVIFFPWGEEQSRIQHAD